MYNVVLEISVPAPIKHQKRLGAMLAADETSYANSLILKHTRRASAQRFLR